MTLIFPGIGTAIVSGDKVSGIESFLAARQRYFICKMETEYA